MKHLRALISLQGEKCKEGEKKKQDEEKKKERNPIKF